MFLPFIFLLGVCVIFLYMYIKGRREISVTRNSRVIILFFFLSFSFFSCVSFSFFFARVVNRVAASRAEVMVYRWMLSTTSIYKYLAWQSFLFTLVVNAHKYWNKLQRVGMPVSELHCRMCRKKN